MPNFYDIEMHEDDAAREAELLDALNEDLYICETQGCEPEDGICERCGTVYEYEAETRDFAEYDPFY
jgi:hypothetical protein